MTVTAQPRGQRRGPLGNLDDHSRDPFIQRIARPQDAEKDRRSRDDIVEGLKILHKQRERAEAADDYYDGDVGMTFASKQVRKLLAKQGLDEDEFPDFNYAKIPVDAIANRLQVAAIKVGPKVTEEDAADDGEIDGEDTADVEGGDAEGGGTAGQAKASADDKTIKKAARAVKRLDRANRMDVYRKDLMTKASKHGDSFLFVWPVRAGGKKGKIVSVDMRVNSAHDVAFVYNHEDPLQVDYVIKSWATSTGEGSARKTIVRANLYYPGLRSVDTDGEIIQGPGRIERWTTEENARPENADSWRRVHEAESIDADEVEDVAADEFSDPDGPPGEQNTSDDIESEFGLTWFHFRNGVPCGVPEHASAYGPQTLINKLVWSLAGTIDYLGFPQRWIMVDPKIDDPLLNVVDPDHPEDEDDDPENETGHSGLRSDPSEVWRLFGKATGQYSAADPDSFLKPLDRMIKSMSELTDVPQYAFTKASGDMPSGEAIRGLDAPFLAKILDRQARYDPELQDAYELALRMLGILGVAVDVRWVPAAPVNDLNGINVLKGKRDLGVPTEVLLNEMGYPDEQIDVWLKDLNGADFERRVAMLVQIGTAVQTLGAGVTLGVVSDVQMQALIARLLGNLMEGTQDPEKSPDGLPAPTFRDPPPVNPAMAAVEAGKQDPLRQAQVKATHATADSSRASADTSRASAEMMRSGLGAVAGKSGQSGKLGQSQQRGTPAKKVAPRPVRPSGSGAGGAR